MSLSAKLVQSFQQVVLNFYRHHGRHQLPWRTTHTTPYHILVSEIMLQQTQVDRVIPKFLAFVDRFPTIVDLAKASQSDVIRLWSGLGYNRRARFLHLASQEIVGRHGGTVPSDIVSLTALSGIGPYTATAILAFAYNRPVSVIETNVRTVYIHHFSPDQSAVSDTQLLPYITATIDVGNPRQWYAALMDYGTHLKNTVGNLAQKSKTYAKQSKFEGSTRQLRGAILRELTRESPQTILSLTKVLVKNYATDKEKMTDILTQLQTEKFIIVQNKQVKLL